MLKAKLKITIIAVWLFLPNVAIAENNSFKGYELFGWKIDFGIDERLRYEYKENFDFNASRKDNGSLLYNRVRLNSKAVFEDKYELFIEGMDLRVGSSHLKKPNQEDGFDLHQAYFKIKNVANLKLDLKLGRQELAYGKGRLIWNASWNNRINHFDAAVLHFKDNGFYADVFSGLRVGYDTNHFNRPNTHESLSGIYAGYQKDKNNPLIEWYFINQADLEDPGNLRRYTIGTRLYAKVGNDVVIDFEVPYQFGNNQAKDINAYAVHFDISKGFDIAWKPKLNFIYNLASGDEKAGDNKTTTFIPVYQSTHAPYGIMDFFRWENMQEAAIEITLLPHKKLKVLAATNFFWLYNEKDSWYNSSGTKLRTDTSGDTGHYVGQELSLIAQYSLKDYIKLETGYAHFFTGSYVKNTGPNDDADWFYLQFRVKL